MTRKLDTKKEDMLQVMQIRPPKLKDSPRRRSRVTIHCKEQFGFLPETIIIDKEHGRNNAIIVSAVVPKKAEKAAEAANSMPEGQKNSKKLKKESQDGN